MKINWKSAYLALLAWSALLLVPTTWAADRAAPEIYSGDGFSVVESGAYRPIKPVQATVPDRVWNIAAETQLRQVLQSWAAEEGGWQVYWPASADGSEFVTDVAVSFKAKDFQQAVSKLMEGLPPEVSLSVTFNRGNSPKLLHVSESVNRQQVSE